MLVPMETYRANAAAAAGDTLSVAFSFTTGPTTSSEQPVITVPAIATRANFRLIDIGPLRSSGFVGSAYSFVVARPVYPFSRGAQYARRRTGEGELRRSGLRMWSRAGPRQHVDMLENGRPESTFRVSRHRVFRCPF